MSKSITLTVTKMKCSNCETIVTEKLFTDKGVLGVTPSHQNNLITIEYEEKYTNLKAIKQLITASGYSVD